MTSHNGYALVLAGGGAKGCYQMGAWRALREHDITVDAVSGASVGSLNGAIIAQGDPETGNKIWDDINLDKIVNIPPEMIKNGRLKINTTNLGKMMDLTAPWRTGLLLDTTPMRQLMNKHLDEDLIRANNIEFGISTINITDFKPMEVYLDQIPHGQLGDYLMASASFPSFKNAEIDGKKFLDGALHDNIPFGMLKARGYRRFIIIDISGVGINRRPDITGTETIYIKNSIEMGGVLDFSPEFLKNYTELGYLDTKRIWSDHLGLKYFYTPDADLEEKLLHIAKGLPPAERLQFFGGDLLPKEYIHWKNRIYGHMECTALALGVHRIKGNTLKSLLDEIWTRLNTENPGLPPFCKNQFSRTPMEQKKSFALIFNPGAHLPKTAYFKHLHPEIPAARLFVKILMAHYN